MRSLYVACLVLASALPAWAAPPEVVPKLDGKVGKPVLFDVKLDKGKQLGWAPGFDKAKCPVVRLHSDDPAVVSFMAIPDADGDFYLTFWTIGEKGFSQAVISVGGKKKDDDKKDDVKPTPVAAAWVIVVEETAARTPAVSAVLGDLAMWRRIEAKGVKWRLYDKDSADAKAKQYDQFAAPVGLPAVLLLDAGGKVVRAVKLPATAAELESLAGGK